MYTLCYLFQTNCFVHSFPAKDYIILTRYSKASSLSYDSSPKITQNLPLRTTTTPLLLKVLGTVGKPFGVVVGIFG